MAVLLRGMKSFANNVMNDCVSEVKCGLLSCNTALSMLPRTRAAHAA